MIYIHALQETTLSNLNDEWRNIVNELLKIMEYKLDRVESIVSNHNTVTINYAANIQNACATSGGKRHRSSDSGKVDKGTRKR